MWANAGTTSTRRLRVATNWKASHGELPPDFDINYVRAPENLFLGPSARSEFGTVFIPMRDIQAAIEQRLHLYVWGRATYDDMFEGSESHFFNFCHRLEVAGTTIAARLNRETDRQRFVSKNARSNLADSVSLMLP
jgi:hypothetical protein